MVANLRNRVFGPFSLDVDKAIVRIGIDDVHLTMFEVAILMALLDKQGEVVSKKELAAVLYPDSVKPRSNGIEVMIRRLRKKLDNDGKRNLITTYRGQGYCLATNDDLSPPQENDNAQV